MEVAGHLKGVVVLLRQLKKEVMMFIDPGLRRSRVLVSRGSGRRCCRRRRSHGLKGLRQILLAAATSRRSGSGSRRHRRRRRTAAALRGGFLGRKCAGADRREESAAAAGRSGSDRRCVSASATLSEKRETASLPVYTSARVTKVQGRLG